MLKLYKGKEDQIVLLNETLKVTREGFNEIDVEVTDSEKLIEAHPEFKDVASVTLTRGYVNDYVLKDKNDEVIRSFSVITDDGFNPRFKTEEDKVIAIAIAKFLIDNDVYLSLHSAPMRMRLVEVEENTRHILHLHDSFNRQIVILPKEDLDRFLEDHKLVLFLEMDEVKHYIHEELIKFIVI